MSKLAVIVLAAGEGKRMRSAVPKVMHEICQRPMLSYVLDAASSLKPKKIIVVLSPKRPEVKKILDKKIGIALQREQKGTADAVSCALKAVPSDCRQVMVLYGDTPLIKAQTVQALLRAHVEADAACTVLTAFPDDPKGYGRVLRNDGGRFLAIVEEKDATAGQKLVREVNTGLYCFDKEALAQELKNIRPDNNSGEYYLTDVLGRLLNSGRKVETASSEDPFEVQGVNSRKELFRAERAMRFALLENFMDEGVSIEDPASTFIASNVRIGRDTKILPFTYIEKDVVIGDGCVVGPFCHLRPGTVLGNKVSVGNFAEVKNSVLNEGAVMHHLGYLGDTSVGRKVNIGAGVVVANFDGKNKNKTVIRDQAFIGSNAVLIAPVKIGRKATVGAGSVVVSNHNVADKSVVAGVPARLLEGKKDKTS